MRRFNAFLLILLCLAATSAAPHPDDLSKKFVGAWRLVSIEGLPPGRTNFMTAPPASSCTTLQATSPSKTAKGASSPAKTPPTNSSGSASSSAKWDKEVF
jgi:hypothetical protein